MLILARSLIRWKETGSRGYEIARLKGEGLRKAQVRRRENALFSMDRSALRPVERGTHEMVLATRTG